MLLIGAIVVGLVVLFLIWEVLRRFSCLNCLLGLLFLGIGVALLVLGGFIHLNMG